MIKLPFDKVYCIHLAEDEKRHENIKNEFDRLGLSDQVEIWWTCKRSVSNDVAGEIDGLKTTFYGNMDREYPENNVLGSVFNCALEHYTIIKQAYIRGFNNVCVMEDDIKFICNEDRIKNVLDNIPGDYDLIKFWSTEMLFRDNGNREDVFSLLGEDEKAHSTLFYALSRNGMKRYIELMDEKFSPSDIPFNEFGKGYKRYQLNAVVARPEDRFSSDITNMTIKEESDAIMRRRLLSNNPLLSIIIPCFNSARYIGDAIESVKRNKYCNWECVIVDDGSTDNTVDIVKTLVDGDERFRVVLMGENKGTGAARNIGIREAKGDYILALDSDDILMSEYPYNAMAFLEDNPKYSLYFGGFQCSGLFNKTEENKWKGYKEMLLRPCIAISAVFKKECAIDIGGFDENLEAFEDYDFWIRYLYHNDRVKASNEIMIEYRTRPNSRHFLLSGHEHIKILKEIMEKNKKIYDEFSIKNG